MGLPGPGDRDGLVEVRARRGPFALSRPGALASLARAAGLQPIDEVEVEVV